MSVTICDVGPRDGLQNEANVLSPGVRAELVTRLSGTGLPRIEAASFVSPKRVPQMEAAEQVVAGIQRRPGVAYAGLALNEKGYERLLASGLDEVHFAFAASETFNQANSNAAVEQSLGAAASIVERAMKDGIRATVTIATAFGCPFEGEVPYKRVLELTEHLVSAGFEEVVFADTIGVAVPRQVRRIISEATSFTPVVGVHLHNTRNTGFANALVALEAGAAVLDASVGGLGGCPFAPRATGNIATEDLVYLLHGEGIHTGIDLGTLVSVVQWVERVLDKELPGQVYKAGMFAPVVN